MSRLVVVDVERQRVAVLLGGLRVNEVQRLVVGVHVLLEDPALDLGSAIGELDAVEFVLDDGGGFSLRLDGGRRGRSCSCGSQDRRSGIGRGLRGRLRLGGRGSVRRDGLGVRLGAVEAEAEEDGQHDEHHEK